MGMYAIIRSGSRQFRVKVGDLIDVDLTEKTPGEAVEFHDVLFIGDANGSAKVGTPIVKGSRVLGECVAEVKGRKIHSVKYKQRKNQYRKFGHRQRYTRVKIVDIVG
jgi:large subunit ribosomal protein L21